MSPPADPILSIFVSQLWAQARLSFEPTTWAGHRELPA